MSSLIRNGAQGMRGCINGAKGTHHVGHQGGEEGAGGEVAVVALELLAGGPHHLHGDELVALLLEAGHDLANQTALHAVGLDHDVGNLRLLVLRLWEGGGVHRKLKIQGELRQDKRGHRHNEAMG